VAVGERREASPTAISVSGTNQIGAKPVVGLLRSSDEGASAAEYALLAAAIAGVIALIVFTLGITLRNSYQESCTEVTNGQGDC
jgi:Flp pilus assembly pilin Flp